MTAARPDAIILGAGAAGLFCALTAARRGARCVLVDHASLAGRKVRLSGGGKGNVTNRRMGPEYYVGADPAFCSRALRSCPPRLVLDWLDEWGFGWEEREEGRVFGCDSASLLVEALTDHCRELGADFLFGRESGEVRHENGVFTVRTSRGFLSAPRLVLALGSPAWPQAGATDLGFRLARALGHRVIPAYPALVPLVLPEEWPLHGLAGLSASARVRVEGRDFAEPLLFTHKGLSGPVILRASCFWRPGKTLEIDFLPDHSLRELLHAPENGHLTPLTLLRRQLPERLAERLIPADLAEKAANLHAARWSRKDRELLIACVHNHRVQPLRTEGLRRAEAAAGGVDVSLLSPRTMESRVLQGLYVIGENMDVTGVLGGYNLHWAWASGKAAGEALSGICKEKA